MPLSCGGDVNGIRIDDLLSRAVLDSRRSEQNRNSVPDKAIAGVAVVINAVLLLQLLDVA
jgi:hypothetical protein